MTITHDQRLVVVERALSLLGNEYVLGAASSRQDDCSGVAMYSLKPYHRFPIHRAADMVHSPGVRTVRAGRGAVKMDEHGNTAKDHKHGKLAFPRRWLLLGDLVWYYDLRFPPHVATYVGKQHHKGRTIEHAVVNATNSERGIELIEMDEYTPRVGFGFIEH